MNIKPPLGKGGDSSTVSDSSLASSVLSEMAGTADRSLPYRWDKQTNSFKFVDGKTFYCPMSIDQQQDGE